MATTPFPSPPAPGGREIDYPTGDGRPMAETPVHKAAMVRLIHVLQHWFADEPHALLVDAQRVYA